jgi:2-methylcitrate dehydratase
MPEQYAPERIRRRDVQELLCRVVVHANADYSKRFPDEMPCRITVALNNGHTLTREMHDYPGFFTHPMSWDQACAKFTILAEPFTTADLRARLVTVIDELEWRRVDDLTQLLAEVRVPIPAEESNR